MILCSGAGAQVVISADITTSTTWTANNVYQLQGDIYVRPGASLTIQPGTVVASTNNSTLAICRGAQIFAKGRVNAPIIFTSDDDRATWTGGNPQTGTYRQLANNEWGNVAIMGSGYISENQVGTNTPAPSASNYADMEGLNPAITSLNDYGGGNDDDDSGSLNYVSLRYGGRTVAPTVELNGLSLGGVGRNTDIHHIEILNNLDDGIEVWGGTVNLKYLSIWNVGDDSLDLDQGWRGKAQFGLIVQGYSGVGSQGSGFGDNGLEIDGAELCNWQPVTTAVLYNFTVIGSPPIAATNGTAGDQLVEYRDNANVQIRNSIFMDAGDDVLRNGFTDGENGNTGYGCNGTLTWAQRWTTPHTVTSAINPFANPAAAYTAQVNGNLIDFRGNLYFNNIRPNTYNEANNRLVFAGGGGTNNANNTIVAASPIAQITRGAAVSPNGVNTTFPVIFLDPAPQGPALTAAESAPADCFFTPAHHRGAFGPNDNWVGGWTATARFGMVPPTFTGSTAGSSTTPQASFVGAPLIGLAALSVQFTDTSVSCSPIATWAWTFGDGSTSSLQSPLHTYTQPGIYSVTLTVTNLLGNSGTSTLTNYIRVLPPAGTGPALQGIVFNELVYDDAGSGNEFIELFRQPNGPSSLAGCYVIAATATTQTVVALAPSGAAFSSSGHYVFGAGGTALLAPLPDSATSLRLHDATGALQDTLVYEGMAGALPPQLLQGHPLFGEHVYDPLHPTSWSRDADGHVTAPTMSQLSDNGLEWRVMTSTRGLGNNQPDLRADGTQAYTGLTSVSDWDGSQGPPLIAASPAAPPPASGGNHVLFPAPQSGGRSFFYKTEASDNFQLDGWFYLDLPPIAPGERCVWSVGLCGTTDTNYLLPDPWREAITDNNGDTGVTWTYEVTNPNTGPVGRLSLVDNEAGGREHLVLWSASITNAGWYRLGLGVSPDTLSVRYGGDVGGVGAHEFERPHYAAYGGLYVGIRQSSNVGFALRVDDTIFNTSWGSQRTTGPGCDGNCPPRNANPGVLDRSVPSAVQTFAILLPSPGVPYSAEQLCFYMAARSRSHLTQPQVRICPAINGTSGALEPGPAVGTFTLQADGLDWWVADLPNQPSGAPYLLPAGDVFYVLELPASIQPPIVAKLADGSPPELVQYVTPGPNSTWATRSPAAFALKWKCAGSSSGLENDVDSEPTITDMPMLTFRLTTDVATPQVAVLVVGFTPLQFDLTPLGAPTCKLFTTLDNVLGFVTASSAASFPVAVPPGLPIGLQFHSQWGVLDASYNAFGVRTTNRHTLTVQ